MNFDDCFWSKNILILLLPFFVLSAKGQTIKSISSSICDSINSLEIIDENELNQAQRSIYNYELVKYPTLIVDITDLNKPRQFNEFNYKINRELLRDCEGYRDQFSFLPLTKILDVEGLFNSNQYDSLERLIIDFIITKKVDLLVVSLDDPYPFTTFEEFANEQREHWNVGGRYENGGILLVLSKSNKEYYLAVNKREKDLIDEAICQDILRSVSESEFSNSYYFQGILSIIKRFKKELN